MEPTDNQIVGLRARLAEATRQGIWLSALETRIMLSLLTWWQRAKMRGYSRPNEGMPPTVGSLRREGVTHIFVTCAACRPSGNSRMLALKDLHMPPGRRAIPDHAAFIDLPNLCRFRCTRCGSRKVSVMAHKPTGLNPDNHLKLNPLKSTWDDRRCCGPSDFRSR